MINNWQVPRNKRRLYPVVDILSLFTLQNLGEHWQGDLTRQLDFEAELERFGIKRIGQRRDRRGSGARTYESWLYNLGLIFTETNTGITRTTLAGDALLSGQPPVPIIRNQLMKLQYPSTYSIRSRVNINNRFQIRPFRFILRLLEDQRVQTLSKQEIGRFVITEGENETDECYENVVSHILNYRTHGDEILSNDFETLYQSSTTGIRSRQNTISYLEDIANTFINYLEYTQLIRRNADGAIFIIFEMLDEVKRILNDGTPLRSLNRTHDFGIENFQRNYGLAPCQNRDNRNFGRQNVSDSIYRERRIRSELLHIAGTTPICNISNDIILRIATSTGYDLNQVESALNGFRPDTFSLFEASYINMAISGRELATEFEIATQGVFEQLGFHTEHVGAQPLNPDVYIESPLGYSGILDTKAYRRYSITNDHRNRMVINYIPSFQNNGLEFFMYIADGFGSNIPSQIQNIASVTNINGSVISAANVIRLLQRNQTNPITHQNLRNLFACNDVITVSDIDSI